MRISSGTARDGWVSLSWIAAFLGSSFESALPRRNLRIRSAREPATRTYSCAQRARPPDPGGEPSCPELEAAADPDVDLLLRPADLPGVGTAQPVVRLLALPAVVDGLPEHPVLVAEPVSHRGQLHRGHGIEKA